MLTIKSFSPMVVAFLSSLAFAQEPAIVISNQTPANAIVVNNPVIPPATASTLPLRNALSNQAAAIPSAAEKTESIAADDQVFQDLFVPLESVMKPSPTLSFSSDHRAIIVGHFDGDQQNLCALYNQAYGRAIHKPTLVADRKIIACS